MGKLTASGMVLDSDGYTLSAFIDSKPRLHSALRFSYRPTTSLEKATIIDGKYGLNEVQTISGYARVLTQKITKWDATDRNGAALPITVDALLNKLHPELLSRLFSIVINSHDGGDIDTSRPIEGDSLALVPDFLAEKPTSLVETELKN